MTSGGGRLARVICLTSLLKSREQRDLEQPLLSSHVQLPVSHDL
jgi:hypothetical protein